MASHGFGQIFSKHTQAIFYNWKQNPVQRMLDFDFLCGKHGAVSQAAKTLAPWKQTRYTLVGHVDCKILSFMLGVMSKLTSPSWRRRTLGTIIEHDLCIAGRETPSVACVVQPGNPGGFQKVFFGREEVAIPLQGSVPEATKAYPAADVFINFASFRRHACPSCSSTMHRRCMC